MFRKDRYIGECMVSIININNGVKELYKILYLASCDILVFSSNFAGDIFIMNPFINIVMDD